MKNNMGIFNIIIIVYNLITAISNSINGLASYTSIIILGINLFITITAIRNNGKSTSNTICMVLEVITGLIILTTIV